MAEVVFLECAVCGAGSRGVQWWNRDDGYGICDQCAMEIEQKYGRKELEDCYGKQGVNWGLNSNTEESKP